MCGSRSVPSSRSTRPGSRPRHGGVVLGRAVEQQLQADADAEQVGALADRLADRLLEAGAPQRRHRRPGRALARHHQPPRAGDGARVVRHDDVGAGPLHGRAQRAQVAGAVVDAAPPSYARPWWTAGRRGAGSGAQAARSASASALNAASTTWWSSSPSAVRCRLTRPARANESSRCGHRLAVTPPTGWPVSSRSMADTPRPPRSTTQTRERLVERRRGVAEAADAGAVAERAVERLAERDAGVLDGVVLVDLEVAVDLQVEVHAGVERERVEHVVEEADAGRDRGAAGAVDHEPRRRSPSRCVDARDGGAPAPEAGRARPAPARPPATSRSSSSASAASRRSVSGGVCTVARITPCSSGSWPNVRITQPRSPSRRNASSESSGRRNVTNTPGLGQHLDAERLESAPQPAALGHVRHGVGAHLVRVREGELGRHRRLQRDRARRPERVERAGDGRRGERVADPQRRRAPSPWRACGRRSGSRAWRSGRRSRRRRTPGTPGRRPRGPGTTRHSSASDVARRPPRRSGCWASRARPAARPGRAPAAPS